MRITHSLSVDSQFGFQPRVLIPAISAKQKATIDGRFSFAWLAYCLRVGTLLLFG